jgi:uncharacterized membrane protein YdbT with pleckstrin-like domain
MEKTLIKTRLHWAIFIPALLTFLVLFIPALLAVFSLNVMVNAITQIIHLPSYPGWIWMVAFTPAVVFGGTMFLITWNAYSHSEITLTNRRLIFRAGFLSRITGELPLQNVEAIFIIEPLIGRLFGFGTILVTSVGASRFPLRLIEAPQVFHATLQSAISDAKRGNKAVPKMPSPTSDDSRYMPKG